jgi:hypothetical protein
VCGSERVIEKAALPHAITVSQRSRIAWVAVGKYTGNRWAMAVMTVTTIFALAWLLFTASVACCAFALWLCRDREPAAGE